MGGKMIEPAEILYALVDKKTGLGLRSNRGYRIYTYENKAKSTFKQLLRDYPYRFTKENTKLIKYIPQKEIIIE